MKSHWVLVCSAPRAVAFDSRGLALRAPDGLSRRFSFESIKFEGPI